MSTRARWSASLALSLAWLAVVTLSAAVGLRHQLAKARALVRLPYTATATTDALLGRLGPGLTTRRLLATLAELPAGEAVLFVGVEDHHRYSQDLYTVSLVALPRQVPALACSTESPDGHSAVPLDPELRIGGVLYDGLEPPAGSARELAPGVWWRRLSTPLPATSAWTRLCRS